MNTPNAMPRPKSTKIRLKPDTLNDEVVKFEHKPLTTPLFLNSVPKSGSHLLRNIMRMFVPLDQHYGHQFIQWGNLQQHVDAFRADRCLLSWGHLLFSDASAVEAALVRKIILVRDPHTWILSRARFFVSDQFGDNAVVVKNAGLSADHLINLMIFGIHQKALPMREMYNLTAIAWLGANASLVRYEDLVQAVKNLDSPEAKAFFSGLMVKAGIDGLPDDWQERVRIGSDRKQSSTARENLSKIVIDVPNELSDEQKALAEYAAPGLRKFLGYE